MHCIGPGVPGKVSLPAILIDAHFRSILTCTVSSVNVAAFSNSGPAQAAASCRTRGTHGPESGAMGGRRLNFRGDVIGRWQRAKLIAILWPEHSNPRKPAAGLLREGFELC